MKNFLIAPDSFKGTMEADEVCHIIADSIRRHIPDATIKSIPMADGGEGIVDTYLNLLGGQRIPITVSGPFGDPVTCYYGLLSDGTAVMEMASCAGLPLARGISDPLHATTYGVGEMLAHAARSGVKNVLLGIGGSATNDCGIGMAAALGYGFFDGNGDLVDALACNFSRIARIVAPDVPMNLSITVACDVDNPLCGPNGATYTFGSQKGVSEDMMALLDKQMTVLADIIARDTGVDVKNIPGAGAAGGLGAALVAFLHAELKSGVELVLDVVDFDLLLQNTDMVFTGEGRIDWQSAAGKVPIGVAKRAKAAGVPCVALCGSVGPNAQVAYDYGMTAIFSSIMSPSDFDIIKTNCHENLCFLADSVVRLMLAGGEAECVHLAY